MPYVLLAHSPADCGTVREVNLDLAPHTEHPVHVSTCATLHTQLHVFIQSSSAMSNKSGAELQLMTKRLDHKNPIDALLNTAQHGTDYMSAFICQQDPPLYDHELKESEVPILFSHHHERDDREGRAFIVVAQPGHDSTWLALSGESISDLQITLGRLLDAVPLQLLSAAVPRCAEVAGPDLMARAAGLGHASVRPWKLPASARVGAAWVVPGAHSDRLASQVDQFTAALQRSSAGPSTTLLLQPPRCCLAIALKDPHQLSAASKFLAGCGLGLQRCGELVWHTNKRVVYTYTQHILNESLTETAYAKAFKRMGQERLNQLPGVVPGASATLLKSGAVLVATADSMQALCAACEVSGLPVPPGLNLAKPDTGSAQASPPAAPSPSPSPAIAPTPATATGPTAITVPDSTVSTPRVHVAPRAAVPMHSSSADYGFMAAASAAAAPTAAAPPLGSTSAHAVLSHPSTTTRGMLPGVSPRSLPYSRPYDGYAGAPGMASQGRAPRTVLLWDCESCAWSSKSAGTQPDPTHAVWSALKLILESRHVDMSPRCLEAHAVHIPQPCERAKSLSEPARKALSIDLGVVLEDAGPKLGAVDARIQQHLQQLRDEIQRTCNGNGSHITVVLLSSDRDFTLLLSALRRQHVRTIVVGSRQSMSLGDSGTSSATDEAVVDWAHGVLAWAGLRVPRPGGKRRRASALQVDDSHVPYWKLAYVQQFYPDRLASCLAEHSCAMVTTATGAVELQLLGQHGGTSEQVDGGGSPDGLCLHASFAQVIKWIDDATHTLCTTHTVLPRAAPSMQQLQSVLLEEQVPAALSSGALGLSVASRNSAALRLAMQLVGAQLWVPLHAPPELLDWAQVALMKLGMQASVHCREAGIVTQLFVNGWDAVCAAHRLRAVLRDCSAAALTVPACKMTPQVDALASLLDVHVSARRAEDWTQVTIAGPVSHVRSIASMLLS